VKLRSQAGLTLLEVLISVTLLSVLSVAMIFAMRVGLLTHSKVDSRLMLNRRVAGAQRIVQQELEGLMPVAVPCMGKKDLEGLHFIFFQAEPQSMRLASTFSLQQGWRGQPQILELFVIPGEEGKGVRLVVNETPYNPITAGTACTNILPSPITGKMGVLFARPQPGPQSFVLADQLAYCRFSYLVEPQTQEQKLPRWQTNATGTGWPFAIRIEMAPLEPDPSRLQPMTVTAPIYVRRAVDIQYVDQ